MNVSNENCAAEKPAQPVAKPAGPQRASSISWLKKSRQNRVDKENAGVATTVANKYKPPVVPTVIGNSAEERSQAKVERKAALARLKQRRAV